MATRDESAHEAVVRRVLRELSVLDLGGTAPAMARRIHGTVRDLSGEEDPYRAVKARTNELALELLPEVRERVAAAADPLEMAVRMAIAGNIIDHMGCEPGSPVLLRRPADGAPVSAGES